MTERWINGRRDDGLTIEAGIDGYVILPGRAAPAIDRCPCCDKAFARNDVGLRAARLVADILYPIMERNNAG